MALAVLEDRGRDAILGCGGRRRGTGGRSGALAAVQLLAHVLGALLKLGLELFLLLIRDIRVDRQGRRRPCRSRRQRHREGDLALGLVSGPRTLRVVPFFIAAFTPASTPPASAKQPFGKQTAKRPAVAAWPSTLKRMPGCSSRPSGTSCSAPRAPPASGRRSSSRRPPPPARAGPGRTRSRGSCSRCRCPSPDPWPQTLVQSAWLGSDFTATICGPVWAAGVLAAGVHRGGRRRRGRAGAAGFFAAPGPAHGRETRPARPKRAARASVACAGEGTSALTLGRDVVWLARMRSRPGGRSAGPSGCPPRWRAPGTRMNRSGHRAGTGAVCAHPSPRRRAAAFPP